MLKIGVVGAGTVGQMHMAHFLRVKHCKIVALAEIRPKLRRLVAKKFKIPKLYSDHLEFVKDKEIDAVVVAVRRHNTSPVVFDLLNAGKHVLSEKPAAKTLDQAKKLVATAEEHGVHYVLGYQRRHDEGINVAKKLFDRLIVNGKLGPVVFARNWCFTGRDRDTGKEYIMTSEPKPVGLPQWSQTPEWLHGDLEERYDWFLNVFSHDTNILRYFFGRNPAIQHAQLDYRQGQVVLFDYGHFMTAFEGANNEVNEWETSDEWDEGIEFFFQTGKLSIHFTPPLMHRRHTHVTLTSGNGKTKVIYDNRGTVPAFKLQATHFVENILHGRKSVSEASDALSDMTLIEAIWRHYVRGRERREPLIESRT